MAIAASRCAGEAQSRGLQVLLPPHEMLEDVGLVLCFQEEEVEKVQQHSESGYARH